MKKKRLTNHRAYTVNENFYLLFWAQIRTIFKKRKRRMLAARARKSTHFYEFRAIFSCVLLKTARVLSFIQVIKKCDTKPRNEISAVWKMPFGAPKWTQNAAKREDKSRFFYEVVNKASQLSPYKSYLIVIMIKRSRCLIHQ